MAASSSSTSTACRCRSAANVIVAAHVRSADYLPYEKHVHCQCWRASRSRPRRSLTSEKIDPEINAKIRAEAENNSQIMRTMHFLTDVHGPRLTGSPNYKAAAEWAVKQMTEWGFKNGKLEPWDFVNADGTPASGLAERALLRRTSCRR